MVNLRSFRISRDNFNEKLGSGFPKDSLVLIEGYSGSGKSIISQRIAYGLIENETSVTYISTQMTTKGFINQMYSLDYQISSHLLNGNLLYIPVIPLVKNTRQNMDFIQRLMNAEDLFEKDVIIVDTISSLVKNSVNSEKCFDLLSFFKKLNGLDKTIIMTIEPDSLDDEIVTMLRSSSDINLSLSVKQMSNQIRRTLTVNKFIGAQGTIGDIIGIRIEPKVGLVVEIAAVS